MATLWHAVYDITTGTLLSTGTVVADDITLSKKGWAKKSFDFNPQEKDKKWNPLILDFETIAILRPALSATEFMSLFTDAETSAIIEAATNHIDTTVRQQCAVFLKKIEFNNGVTSLDSVNVIAAIKWLEFVALINKGRAAEILA